MSKERSAVSYKREIASLEKALHDECENSLRLSQTLVAVAEAWFDWDQSRLDELLAPFREEVPVD